MRLFDFSTVFRFSKVSVEFSSILEPSFAKVFIMITKDLKKRLKYLSYLILHKICLTRNMIPSAGNLKFMFSKKATKIDEIFTVNLTLCTAVDVKSTVKILSIFVTFLENFEKKNTFLFLI